MYVGVKLINYPHLYYFSHFTHFTLYLRMCEKYQILFNFVLISKFPISIMETSTLFPRRLEKHKFLLRSIEGVAFLTRDIGNYPCLTEAQKYWRGGIPNKRHWKLSLSHWSFNCWSLLNNSPAIQCCENIQESLQTCCLETASSWNSPSIWTHTTVSLTWTSEIFWMVSCHQNIVQLHHPPSWTFTRTHSQHRSWWNVAGEIWSQCWIIF